MSYPYSLPTTGSLSFVEFFEDLDPYSLEISDTTARRGRLRHVLKEFKKETQSSRDYSLVMNTIEEYLPYLIGIMNCIQTKEITLKKNIETSWRTTLSEHLIHTGSNAPRVTCKDIHYELIFVLMTYAYACALQSSYLLKENNSALYNKAAETLSTAASVFHFVANNAIPNWKGAPENRPIETIREFSLALSKMTLADTQAIAINKALLSNNTSKSLIAKLHMGVADQYQMAYGLITSIKGTHDPVSSDLIKYLADGISFYKTMAKKYLAMHANDSQRMGEAVGFAKECKADLRLLQHSGLSKKHLKKSAFALRAVREEESINELLSKYTLINDTVSYAPVPSKQDLQQLIPGGRGVLELKPYILPNPPFGPTSEGKADISYLLEGRYF
ncbi:BRO1 domain-containing protein [Sporodiniella umbellata]|nr:BRO1 domain-containing protein [Sporodiniella umbellata]